MMPTKILRTILVINKCVFMDLMFFCMVVLRSPLNFQFKNMKNRERERERERESEKDKFVMFNYKQFFNNFISYS